MMTLLFSHSVYGQNSGFTYKDFESLVLAFRPQKKQHSTQQRFGYACMVLAETKKATKNNPSEFNLADYFNITCAFLNLEADDDALNIAYKKFVSLEGSCEYLQSFKARVDQNSIYDRIRSRYTADLKNCNNPKKTAGQPEQNHAETKVSQITGMMKEILQRDQKFRTTAQPGQDWAVKQKPLDIRNQMLIDSLFSKHNAYIGKSVVGEKYRNVMWIVIQHSDINMMERYLPYIKEAVRSDELPEANLKMLIDRIYAVRYKVQIFGTQSHIPMADKKIIHAVIKEYGIR